VQILRVQLLRVILLALETLLCPVASAKNSGCTHGLLSSAEHGTFLSTDEKTQCRVRSTLCVYLVVSTLPGVGPCRCTVVEGPKAPRQAEALCSQSLSTPGERRRPHKSNEKTRKTKPRGHFMMRSQKIRPIVKRICSCGLDLAVVHTFPSPSADRTPL
jgi:hypothetical protein